MKHLVYALVLILMVTSCKPEETGGVKPKELTVLGTTTSTPVNIIPWGDSLWMQVSNRSWLSFKNPNNPPDTLKQLFGDQLYEFSIEKNGIIWMTSKNGFLLIADMNTQTISHQQFQDIIYPESFTNALHEYNETIYLVMNHKAFKWDGTEFKAISIPAKFFARDIGVLQTSLYWPHIYEDASTSKYFLIKSNSFMSPIDTVNQVTYRYNLFPIKSGPQNILVLTNEAKTAALGLITEGGYIPKTSFTIKRMKEKSGNSYYLTTKNELYKLEVSYSGEFLTIPEIQSSDLNGKMISNYWNIKGTWYLYLNDQTIISVKD